MIGGMVNPYSIGEKMRRDDFDKGIGCLGTQTTCNLHYWIPSITNKPYSHIQQFQHYPAQRFTNFTDWSYTLVLLAACFKA